MLKINSDYSIELTRGDTARLTVDLINEVTGKAYEIQPGDRLHLTVKKTTRDPEAAFQKEVQGTGTFHIAPEDTAGLSFGRYRYDVQLTTAGGDVFTLGPYDFKILEEATW